MTRGSSGTRQRERHRRYRAKLRGLLDARLVAAAEDPAGSHYASAHLPRGQAWHCAACGAVLVDDEDHLDPDRGPAAFTCR